MRSSHRCWATAVKSTLMLTIGTAVTLTVVETGRGQTTTKSKPAESQPGYGAAFQSTLAKIGQITPAEFAIRYPAPTHRPGFSWDPTTAKFWDQVMQATPPAPDPATLPSDPFERAKFLRPKHREPWYDFRVNADELAKFRENGFVVSERMGASSFGELFYRVYSRDLPVFISADAILQAWHRSYDAMLEELELTYLGASLAHLLTGMASAVPAAKADYGNGPLASGLLDSDYFLAVARSLLSGQQVPTKLDQDERVAETLRAVQAEQMQTFALFGRDRKMDFSQFKPRGHYELSDALRQYFRAMMWCGRIDLRVAGGFDKTGPLSSPRELGSALVLNDLLTRSGKLDQWRQFDALLQTFVGRADSATFAHLDALLKEAKLSDVSAIKEEKALEKLQAEILAGKFGLQDIRGDVYVNPGASQPIQMPRSFTVLGQRFAIDSWALSKVVYDDISWDGELVHRRIPSDLDVAFSVLGNDHVVPNLVERMTAGPREFRDRQNYQHNLSAIRAVVDQRSAAAWEGTSYDGWLATLRELSRPTTDSKFPEALRSRAWSMKTLSTQLASWTQLRHDTVLYAKQSYTTQVACFYPAGYVEPIPAFWTRMEALAARCADLLEKTPFPDVKVEAVGRLASDGRERWLPITHYQKHQVKFLRRFAAQVGILQSIAAKQLDQKELNAEEVKVLKEVVHRPGGGSGYTRYDGWYPSLFYSGKYDCAKWEPLVADVHTDTPSPVIGDPGCILHQGVGNVDLILIAIENGPDRVVYAGPVFSHYEFETPVNTRRSDSEWQKDANAGKLPPRPEWTRSYLVPGVNPDARDFGKVKDKQ